VVEGIKLVTDALDVGARVEAVFVDTVSVSVPAVTDLVQRVHRTGVRVFHLGPGVLQRVADTVTPQPVLAVVGAPTAALEDLRQATFVVVCVDVRDPGNAGTVVRIADAAGADGVVCCAGTVDPFNPKTVRAAAGSVLHLPVVPDADPGAVLEYFRGLGLRRNGAVPGRGAPYDTIDWTVPCALVLGNESSGLPTSLDEQFDNLVSIAMGGRAESLNVSSAASVLCFEVRRQRNNLHSMTGTAMRQEPGDPR
jgi:TrmH family RNA methyltransferase